MDSQEMFEVIIERVLQEEGGYSNDPDDRGGETKFGISARAFPEFDIAALTLKKAKDIYYTQYWEPSKLYQIYDLELVSKVFSVGVNVGMRTAIKALQRSVRAVCDLQIPVDGILGPITVGQLATIVRTEGDIHNPLLCAFKADMGAYYRSLNQPKFLKGWLNRLYAFPDDEK